MKHDIPKPAGPSVYLFFVLLCLSATNVAGQAEVMNPAMLPTGAGVFWKTTGNANTVDGTHFIGTTDMRPLNFRIGNVHAGRIDSAKHTVFMGYLAGNSSVSGIGNVSIGHAALSNVTTGNYNIAIGDSAGFSASTIFSGINIGTNAGKNALGNFDINIGFFAGESMNGLGNIHIGSRAGEKNTGNNNTFVGGGAGSNSTGLSNTTLLGNGAGAFSNGTENTQIGNSTGPFLTSSYNTLVGVYAGNQILSGTTNTLIGYKAGMGVQSGSFNVFVGDSAGRFSSSGSRNTYVGSKAAQSNIGGNLNTGVGYHVLRSNTTGANNTALGDSANVGSSNLTNATAIGSKAQVNTSNSMVLGSVAGINTATSTAKVAIGNNSPNTRLDVKGDLALRERTIILANGQNNDVTTDTSSFLRIIGPTAAFSISGLANGFDGKLVTLINTTPYNLTIASQSIGSVAANRIMSAEGTIIVGDSGSISFQYSAALSRWMVTSHTHSTTESDGNTDYYSVLGNTTAPATSLLSLMPQMTLTFTPLDTIAYVSFHATGSNPNACGQYGLSFMLRVNGALAQYFNASIEDINNGSNKLWSAAIEVPVTVVANSSNTVDVLWQLISGCSPVSNTPNSSGIGPGPFGSYRSLIVKAPHGYGTVNALNQPALPSSDYWKLAGNAGTNPASDYIGTSDNQSLRMRVNGFHAGWLGTNGSVFLGRLAGNNATGYGGLTAIGDSAMFSNTGGGLGITAIGASALVRNTFGDWNTALGNVALWANTSGGWNTGLGYGALYRNRTGNYNTAVGVDVLVNTLDQDYNTGIGTFALNQNTLGYNNTAVGANALYSNTIGHSNVAVGNLASTSAVAGEFNVSVGHRALTLNTDAGRNVAIGTFALRDQAFSNSITNYDAYNVGVGYSALINNNPANTTANTSGKVNTAIGGFALNVNTTGYQNTGVGYGSNPSVGTLFNTTSLGYLATSTASNYVRVGNTAVTSIFGAVAFNTSDARFKTDVTETVPGLHFITALRPVTYRFQKEKYSLHIGEMQDAIYTENLRAQDASGKRSSGFIAQEVEALADSLNYDFDGLYKPQNEKDTYGLGYAQFVVPLVKSVQELNTQNQQLLSIVRELQSKVKQLELNNK